MSDKPFDAVVVGAGPNGLSAGLELARRGLSVCVLEAKDTIGGGARTVELTAPGFLHDVCSAIHPVGVVSPFFKTLPLEQWGVEWVYPDVALAHPFDDGDVALLHRSVETTGNTLGADRRAYEELMRPFVKRADDFFQEILRPVRIPSHPFLMLRFALSSLRSCASLASTRFNGRKARALFAGCCAHSVLLLEQAGPASSKSTGLWPGRYRGRLRSAGARRRCISARPSKRFRRASAQCGAADTPSAPSCWSRSRASSTRRARPKGSRRAGPTATSRTARTWT